LQAVGRDLANLAFSIVNKCGDAQNSSPEAGDKLALAHENGLKPNQFKPSYGLRTAGQDAHKTISMRVFTGKG
jgi:hypothetical protein